MPRPRLAMRKVRDILRLAWGQGLSHRVVGAAVGIPFTTVADHLRRAKAVGLSWPLPEVLSDAALEALLFDKEPAPPTQARPMPDWQYIHKELRRPGVTLMLLWLEYKEAHPTDGYAYSQFCRHYRAFEGHLDLVMRQEHRAGEKLFVDFPDSAWRSMTAGPVRWRCGRSCSWPCSARRTTSTPRRSPLRS